MGTSPLTHPIWPHKILCPFPVLSIQVEGECGRRKAGPEANQGPGHVISKQKLSSRQGKVKLVVPYQESSLGLEMAAAISPTTQPTPYEEDGRAQGLSTEPRFKLTTGYICTSQSLKGCWDFHRQFVASQCKHTKSHTAGEVTEKYYSVRQKCRA